MEDLGEGTIRGALVQALQNRKKVDKRRRRGSGDLSYVSDRPRRASRANSLTYPDDSDNSISSSSSSSSSSSDSSDDDDDDEKKKAVLNIVLVALQMFKHAVYKLFKTSAQM